MKKIYTFVFFRLLSLYDSNYYLSIFHLILKVNNIAKQITKYKPSLTKAKYNEYNTIIIIKLQFCLIL